jgi:endonuclease-8
VGWACTCRAPSAGATTVPEGDTIFRAARTLDRALAGHTITAFDTQLAQLAVVDRRAAIAGRVVADVSARGKHLLIAMSGDLVLRTHMRMHGSWHIYRPGERWRAPRRDARIVITTDEWIAIAFSVSDAEFLSGEALARHDRVNALGPDLLDPDVDLAEARRRIREAPARHIAEALLRQQSVAGLGNVFKSEVLFLCGVYPFTPVADVSDAALDALLTRGRALIRLNVQEGALVGGGTAGRVTTGRLNPREKLWVYDRAGAPCRTCAGVISSAMETDGRRTYWCPACQREPTR